MLSKILEAYRRDNILHAFLLYDSVFLPDRTKISFVNDLKYVLTYHHLQYNICNIYIMTDHVDREVLEEHLKYCKSREPNYLYIYGNINIFIRYFKNEIDKNIVQKKCFIVMKLEKNNFKKIYPKIDNVEIRKLDLDNKSDYEMFREFLQKYFKLSEDNIKYFKEDRTYIAIHNNRIVSIARISLMLPNTCLIVGVFTVPEYRRRGLAGAVLSILCEHVLNLDIIPFLLVDYNNDPAINLYRRIGFRMHITLPYLKIVRRINDETGGTD
ncbi:MAG: GNAT family N-acetyltransferase [Crenarchaeota archaeon]|nr:GNAT family N-acetyltransferase [Thermoproteota archaeon]